MVPSESALILLLVVSAAVGGAVTLMSTRVPTAAVLVLGQVLGHSVLSIASEHHHGLSLTPMMLATHACASVVCAVLIRGAVLGYGHALSVLRRILPVLGAVLVVPDSSRTPATRYRSNVVLRLLVCSGSGTRGPPLFV